MNDEKFNRFVASGWCLKEVWTNPPAAFPLVGDGDGYKIYRSKKEALAARRERYGHLRGQRHRFGYRYPRVTRVTITVEEI